jgi:trans-aconitate methyltransferase
MSRFDVSFYKRFYLDPRTRVTTREEMSQRARAVAALTAHLQIPVRRILDAGCGLGWMRAPLLRAFPRARYVGLEVSEHLCRRYGWRCASLAQFRDRARFDLIVCYDVMQYLSDRDAARALRNLADLSRGALYFHAPTLEDWRHNADRSVSDSAIRLRPVHWYRARLARHFRHAGLGMHVRRGVPLLLWELEKATSDTKSRKRAQ